MDAQIVDHIPKIESVPQFAFSGFDPCKQQFLSLFLQLTNQ